MTDLCITADLVFLDGDAQAETAGATLQAAAFGFAIVPRDDPDEPAAFGRVARRRHSPVSMS